MNKVNVIGVLFVSSILSLALMKATYVLFPPDKPVTAQFPFDKPLTIPYDTCGGLSTDECGGKEHKCGYFMDGVDHKVVIDSKTGRCDWMGALIIAVHDARK